MKRDDHVSLFVRLVLQPVGRVCHLILIGLLNSFTDDGRHEKNKILVRMRHAPVSGQRIKDDGLSRF